MILTQEQERAVEIIIERFKNNEKYTVISGFAGTGKSSTVKYAIERLKEKCKINPEYEVAYACFTGKACQVLIDKGNKNAVTLHRLLYNYRQKADGTFVKIRKATLDYRIVVVDEVSMVSKELVEALLSYKGVYIIFLGDEFQLPPISEKDDNHLLDNPHARLTKILRQTEGNSIIDLSTLIREGKDFSNFNDADAMVIKSSELTDQMLLWSDIVLCGKNKTRTELNHRIRKLQGKTGILEDGEVLINLHNDWDKISDEGNALTNGIIGTFHNFFENMFYVPNYVAVNGNKVYTYNGIFKSGDESFGSLEIDKELLKTGTPALNNKQRYLIKKAKKYNNKPPYEFDYGYAITVHKSQGSQWNNVIIKEEWLMGDNDLSHRRWLYTGVTRAISKCIIVR